MVKGARLDEAALDAWRDDFASRRAGAASGESDASGAAPGSGAGSQAPSIATDAESLDAPSGEDRDSGGRAGGGTAKSVELKRLERVLVDHLGTRVLIRGSNDRGRIEIDYLSMDDLERVIESMGADPSAES